MPIDRETFERLKRQDEIRAKQTQSLEAFKSRIREDLMFLESDVNWYAEPKVTKDQASNLKDLMSKRYSRLITTLKKHFPEEQFSQLVTDDRDKTLEALINHFGIKPLPKRHDDPFYQTLHHATKKAWGIVTPGDHSKF